MHRIKSKSEGCCLILYRKRKFTPKHAVYRWIADYLCINHKRTAICYNFSNIQHVLI